MTALARGAGLPPLIAIEGIDGAGTTTQARLLAEWLGSRGVGAHLTCEPSSGCVGQLIRTVLAGDTGVDRRSLALLFAADRLHHLGTEVADAREEGKWVITDRYVYSSLAYQSMDLDPAWVAAINREAPDADLTIYVRVDPAVALARVAGRARKREIFETLEQQRKIGNFYDALFVTPGGDRVKRNKNDDALAGQDPARSAPILADPRTEISEDPGGSGRDPERRMQALDGRDPPAVVVDGARGEDVVRDDVRARVKKFASDRGIWNSE